MSRRFAIAVSHAVRHQGEYAPLEVVEFRREVADDCQVGGLQSGLFRPRLPLSVVGDPDDHRGILEEDLPASPPIAMYVEGATSNAEPQGVAQVLLALKVSLQKNNHRVLVQILDLLRGQPLALPELQGTANFFLLYVAEKPSGPLLRGRTALRRCVVFIRSR
jgi:hypothetical protein